MLSLIYRDCIQGIGFSGDRIISDDVFDYCNNLSSYHDITQENNYKKLILRRQLLSSNCVYLN